ncbi:MAG TPA: DUF4276 family protein [Blastocatellia bacterium]|jgi:hypothetical protein|nr:DUF4276 family protein [Blastocatellia bacterium]
MAIIHTLVEGLMDESVANRLIKMAGHTPGTCFGKKGYAKIQAKVRGFNQTSVGANYLVLVDFMDTGLGCPAEVVSQWVPHRRPNLLFRIVVRELESWLLADKENLADFLNVSVAKISADPEQLKDPKLTLVNLARSSRSKSIREALVPDPDSVTAKEGRLYTSEMVRFIQERWDITNARDNSESLNKCCIRLEEMAK